VRSAASPTGSSEPVTAGQVVSFACPVPDESSDAGKVVSCAAGEECEQAVASVRRVAVVTFNPTRSAFTGLSRCR